LVTIFEFLNPKDAEAEVEKTAQTLNTKESKNTINFFKKTNHCYYEAGIILNEKKNEGSVLKLAWIHLRQKSQNYLMTQSF
jgi:hypothetical protein